MAKIMNCCCFYISGLLSHSQSLPNNNANTRVNRKNEMKKNVDMPIVDLCRRILILQRPSSQSQTNNFFRPINSHTASKLSPLSHSDV